MTIPGRLSTASQATGSVSSRQISWQRLASLMSSRYALSVGAQALVSGFHFGLNLLLLRLISPFEYGIFAYAFVLALFASAINNALISTPLTVYTPVLKNPAERQRQEDMFSTLNLALFMALVLAGLCYAWLSGIDASIATGVTLFVAVYSARQYSRSLGYARIKPLVTASGDLSYVLSGILIITVLVQSSQGISVGQILLAMAAANLIAMLVERYRLHGRHRRWLSFADVRGYALIWAQTRWALVGALTTLFLAQAHSLIITWNNGPSAYAPLAAGFVLFGPVRVALLTWQNMVKPELAIALSDNHASTVRLQIRHTSMLMGGCVIAMGITLLVLWPWVHKLLYAKHYADQPMGTIVSIWAVITFFAAIYNAPSAALQALRDFRLLAMGSIYGAVISGVLVSVLLLGFNPEITLFGILAAECFMAVYLTRIILDRLREN